MICFDNSMKVLHCQLLHAEKYYTTRRTARKQKAGFPCEKPVCMIEYRRCRLAAKLALRNEVSLMEQIIVILIMLWLLHIEARKN